MPDNAVEPEPRNKTAGLNVSVSEKRDIDYAAGFYEISVSDYLRRFIDLEGIALDASRIRQLKAQHADEAVA